MPILSINKSFVFTLILLGAITPLIYGCGEKIDSKNAHDEMMAFGYPDKDSMFANRNPQIVHHLALGIQTPFFSSDDRNLGCLSKVSSFSKQTLEMAINLHNDPENKFSKGPRIDSLAIICVRKSALDKKCHEQEMSRINSLPITLLKDASLLLQAFVEAENKCRKSGRVGEAKFFSVK